MTALGFTGTQHGINGNQKNVLATLLEGFRRIGAIWMHNGDCVGADEFAGNIWLQMGGAIHLHPPTNNSKRAFLNRLPMVVSSPPRPYLLRNQDIALAATVMIATPREMSEQKKGGTWYTVRAARHRELPLAIIWPDRTVQWERWPDRLSDFPASADAHPKGGDSVQHEAPSPMSGAVPNEASGDAHNPPPPPRS